jgi:amidase
MSEALWQKSALEIAAGIREKRYSCSEVMISTIERIHALNPKLNAIVQD